MVRLKSPITVSPDGGPPWKNLGPDGRLDNFRAL